jgi:16S rRNA (adenine1518-N6/adenine1519-N6)-dimethyltransferase
LRALKDLTKPYENVEIIKGDVLSVDPAQVFGDAPYRLIANLPYAITSITLRHFLETAHPPERMVILIQREVADRILAQPGDMSLLSLSVQFYATPRFVLAVPPRSFAPPPQVNSAVIALDWHGPITDEDIRARLFTIAKLCFAQRRKQLHNTLPGIVHLPAAQVHAWLAAAEITPDRRPQTLSLAEWIRLVRLDPRRKE